jgi:tRNA threonylcarbamoyladenosine biosynthesis protein TsaE
MNTEPKYSYLSESLEDTRKLGLAIVKNVQTPMLIELSGDLGGGKTALVKEIAKGLGITQTVTSPTFNIHRSYKAPNGMVLEHFDLYRLSDDEIVLNELIDSLNNPDAIVCVEWSQHFLKSPDKNHLTIQCHYINENERRYDFMPHGEKAMAMVEELAK